MDFKRGSSFLFVGQMQAMLVVGASPVGDFIVTLASEVSGSEVRLMQNSFIRYREIP